MLEQRCRSWNPTPSPKPPPSAPVPWEFSGPGRWSSSQLGFESSRSLHSESPAANAASNVSCPGVEKRPWRSPKPRRAISSPAMPQLGHAARPPSGEVPLLYFARSSCKGTRGRKTPCLSRCHVFRSQRGLRLQERSLELDAASYSIACGALGEASQWLQAPPCAVLLVE